ncbi:transcriptional regulator [Nibricoccus aquaticus]|uniref:Transcriptional regulator n=1 Tax=Nibricoccus aquaticus TaxID=2576891 RepID=A0A290Q6S5_9BACT|nr:ATP-binding protein [Nibricoccus aquaticus]ATC64375.1 transcriptional regulator [Nibricoccus aquaticus]
MESGNPTKPWLLKAVSLLRVSLEPPRHELNELDWKAALSPDKARLTEHLSALSNQAGGGVLVYGVTNQGTPGGVSETEIASCINQLANLGRDALEPPIAIDHFVESYQGARLLFIHVPESTTKPVYLRGKTLEHAFIRSGGSTRKASRQEIGTMMLHSRTPKWEDLRASVLLEENDLAGRLDTEPLLRLLERSTPIDRDALLAWMEQESFVLREQGPSGGYITNLGAIAAARQMSEFPSLEHKAVRVIVYDGVNKARTKLEQEGGRGYAIGFQGLIRFVMSQLPQSEVIEQALREKRTLYPEIALREIIANALIHQDFTTTGSGPLVEIFSDRIEITNPGTLLPSKQLDRLIGTQPESRNERLAKAFRRMKICEERVSGLVKAGLEVELYGLPPIQFTSPPGFFKATLFAPKTYAQMSPNERLDACYQHAVLKFLSSATMTNTSLRERLKVPEKQRSMISVIIQEAIEAGRIKPADPDNKSKKFAEYIPYWA